MKTFLLGFVAAAVLAAGTFVGFELFSVPAAQVANEPFVTVEHAEDMTGR